MSRRYSNSASATPDGADEYRLLMPADLRVVKLAVMTTTITRSSVAGRATRLVGGVDLPAAGTWSVPGSHADIGFSLPRRLRRTERWRGRAVEATIVVGEDPDDLLVAVLLETGLATVTREFGRAVGSGGWLVARTDRGPLPWAMSGEVRADGAIVPLRAFFGYHGVWRRGDRAHGWFTLAGTIAPGRAGGRPSIRFSFDLLADAPRAETGVA
jgi:hypothetical protein